MAVLDRIPLRAGERHFVVAPMFHAWGFAFWGLGVLLGSETIMRRRFDPEATLELIDRHRAVSAAMVPVMAQRILELPDEVRARYDTSSLRIIALGGSAIPGDLAIRVMDALGDVVYNGYGSTEVALVSIASPQDLRADPATAGAHALQCRRAPARRPGARRPATGRGGSSSAPRRRSRATPAGAPRSRSTA